MKPRLLDAYCCAGLASKGYSEQFDVTGVDIVDQPNYPYRFIKADALEYIAAHGHEYDVIHASPPCQRASRMTGCRPGLAATYPELIGPTRELLEEIGAPYVIENVVGAPLRPDLMLCGQMFGLPLYRHRVFESNMLLMQPTHPRHLIKASKAGHYEPGTIISVSGHVSPIALARKAMGGVDWCTRDELAEGIPPVFAQFIGEQLMAHLTEAAA